MKLIKEAEGYGAATYGLESTGKQFQANQGTIVIKEYLDGSLYFYDKEESGLDCFTEDDFIPEERQEIAEYMIGLWSRWGGLTYEDLEGMAWKNREEQGNDYPLSKKEQEGWHRTVGGWWKIVSNTPAVKGEPIVLTEEDVLPPELYEQWKKEQKVKGEEKDPLSQHPFEAMGFGNEKEIMEKTQAGRTVIHVKSVETGGVEQENPEEEEHWPGIDALIKANNERAEKLQQAGKSLCGLCLGTGIYDEKLREEYDRAGVCRSCLTCENGSNFRKFNYSPSPIYKWDCSEGTDKKDFRQFRTDRSPEEMGNPCHFYKTKSKPVKEDCQP